MKHTLSYRKYEKFSMEVNIFQMIFIEKQILSLLETKKDKEAISKAIFITFDIASAFRFFSQVKKVYNIDLEELGIEYEKFSGILHSYSQSVLDTLRASTNLLSKIETNCCTFLHLHARLR